MGCIAKCTSACVAVSALAQSSVAHEPADLVVTSQRDGNREIYVMDTEGQRVDRLTVNDAIDYFAAWSPDGTEIAFSSERDGDLEIFLMDAYGADLRQLTQNGVHDSRPDWHPDGSKILFCSERDGNREVYFIAVDGSNPTRLTFNGSYDADDAPKWSADGQQIVFSRGWGNSREIWKMDADGANQTQLTFNSAAEVNADWSPDASKIVFNSDRDGSHQLYVMNADGSNQTALTSGGTIDDYPDWSPDGEHILFRSKRDGNYEIYIMDADGQNQTNVSNNPSEDHDARWSPIPPCVTLAPAGLWWATLPYVGDVVKGSLSIWNCSEEAIEVEAQWACDWLDIDPVLGRIPAGKTADLALDIDATGLLPDAHSCLVTFAYGDTGTLEVPISVEMLSPLEVAITDAPLSVRRGRNLRFEFSVENLTDERRSGEVWFEAFFEGRPYPGNPIEGPYRGFVTAGYTLHAFNYLMVPERLPVGGAFEICTVVGDEPGAWSQDCFEFSVLP